MSFYEGPSADPELMKLTRQQPTAIQEAMLQTLRAGRWSGYIKPDIDLPTLADRICQTMLQVGLDVMRHNSAADQVAELLCRIILQGLAVPAPKPMPALDRSDAFTAASDVVGTWADDSDAEPSDKAAHVRAVARTEFGRKGYEVTTIRDIASAAGLGTGTVYRVIGSKDELLASIMESFGRKVEAGWVSVLRSDATPDREVGRAELGQRQRPGSVFRRVQDPTRLDAAIAADGRPGMVVHHPAAADEIAALRGHPVGRDSDRHAVHRDAGTMRHRPAVDTGEHPARRREAHGVGARQRHRPARRRGSRQVSARTRHPVLNQITVLHTVGQLEPGWR